LRHLPLVTPFDRPLWVSQTLLRGRELRQVQCAWGVLRLRQPPDDD
jgi:hypothetical protein